MSRKTLVQHQEARLDAILGRATPEAEYHVIDPIVTGLYLGEWRARKHVAELPNIRLVIALGCKESEHERVYTIHALPAGVREHKVYIDDWSNANILPDVRACHMLIVEALARGESVLVHCAAGISRSATIVMGHLMLTNAGWTAETALAVVEARRPCVWPNPGFFKQLQTLTK